MRQAAIASVVILAVLLGAAFIAAEDRGRAEFSVFGGSRGEVPFTHRQHQEKLNDCNICHDYFPQQKDAIKSMKEKGELEKKLVMNKLCTKCHKAEKAAGNKTGPITCSQCHIRKKG